jgi:hypothetical protein
MGLSARRSARHPAVCISLLFGPCSPRPVLFQCSCTKTDSDVVYGCDVSFLLHEQVYQLLGEDVKALDDGDRGEIHLRLRWAERKFEDDQALDKLRLNKLIRLQAWARRIQGLCVLKKLRVEREALMKMIRAKAVKITNTCRIRIARKEYKRRSRFLK